MLTSFKAKTNSSISQGPLITGTMRAMGSTHTVKKFVQNAIRPRPVNYTILHKIIQNLRQSFFRTHCVTLTENMRSVIQRKLLKTILLPRPPIEFVKH